jgi:hypothetical protein
MKCYICRKEIPSENVFKIKDVTEEQILNLKPDTVVAHDELRPMCLEHRGVRKLVSELARLEKKHNSS